jgi:membrane protease YdiL (CAAX protease family)
MLGLTIVGASRLCLRHFEWARALDHEFRSLLNPLSNREVLVLAGASSIGEEMFFRGALIPAVGLLGSSVIFALLHVGPKARYLPWTVTTFLAGLVFGKLFLWTGDLTGAVLAHFTVNYLNLRHIARASP